jgi:S-DNA-T family DNA segregation ATPase FtsK/SpoIIIE
MTKAMQWLRANARHVPVALTVPAVLLVFVAVWLVVHSLVLTLVLGSLLTLVLACIWAAIAFAAVDARPIMREVAAKKVGLDAAPSRPVRAYEVEPNHRPVPQIPASTFHMEPVPAYPVDVDDPEVVIPMPPLPDPIPAKKVTVAPGKSAAWPLLHAQRTVFTDPIPVGFTEDGTVVHLTMRERNLLLAGEIGGGKSTALQMLVATAALDPLTKLYLFDAKLVELNAWRGCAAEFVEDDTERANAVLANLLEEMRRRYRFMQRNNLRALAPSEEFPTLAWFCDELAEFTDDKTKDDPEDRFSPTRGAIFSDRSTRLASLGRAAGIIPIAATQEPRYDVVPPKLRNKFVFRWALRCQRPTQVNIILGDGWDKDAPAHRIDATEKGVGYLLHEGAAPVRLQAFYLSDSDIRDIAKRAEALRRGTASPITSPTASAPLQWPVPKWTSDAHEAARSAPEAVSEAVRNALAAGWSAFRVVRDVLGWPASGEALQWHKAIVLAIGERKGPNLQVVRGAETAGEENA